MLTLRNECLSLEREEGKGEDGGTYIYSTINNSYSTKFQNNLKKHIEVVNVFLHKKNVTRHKQKFNFFLKEKALGRKTYSVFICLAGGGSLFCELESSEKPNWVANSVGS